ncbi:MAG TPA: ferrous iron transport protein B [Ruminiclostridium sp.]|nr:ferrous iron transport protein B [Ruminiclostridium sp.]
MENVNNKKLKHLVLVGNPNVGKSVFFNALTGKYVDVSNFPGTTVDISTGRYGDYIVEDTPGIYGVSSFNDEERVARDVIINGDLVLNVIDAVHMQRDIFLTQQLIDMGKKVIVAVNLIDEATKNGIKVDTEELSRHLGVEVVATSALKGIGVDEVKRKIENAKCGIKTEGVQELLDSYNLNEITEAEVLMLLEDDEVLSERKGLPTAGKREEIYKNRRIRVDKIVDSVLSDSFKGTSMGTAIGRLLLKPVTGIPILLAIMAGMFWFIGVFIAQTVVNFTEGTVMNGIYKPFIKSILSFIPKNSFIGSILVGDYGLLTMTVIYIFGLLLPLTIGFYMLMSILEDSGFLPRIAVLADKTLSRVGLNGRAIIPLILGFGCITMATMTTRLLGSRRERVIATFLLGLTIPCSAQFGVIIGLLAPLGMKYIIAYTIILVFIFGVSGVLLNKLLPGESTQLFIDLPQIRMPQFKNVMKKTLVKAKAFLFEATPIFALGAVLITVLQYTGALKSIENAISPLTVQWLKLPPQASVVFIMGIIRRDFGAAGLSHMVLTNPQMLVALITITLFVPCVASIIMIFKERSKVEATAIWLGSFAIAFLIGGVLAHIIV